MNAEAAGHLLAHALPPAARHDRFRRNFDRHARGALLDSGCNDAQVERLQRILAAVAYYTTPGPRMAEVRAGLATVEKQAQATASSLRALLDAPEHDEAQHEARGWLLHALAVQHASSILHYAEGEEVGRRLLAAIDEVTAAAEFARERMPKQQTRACAHWYPVALIDAALSVDGPPVTPSASPGSPFHKIACTCYAAAGMPNDDPLRAIRVYKRQAPSLGHLR